MVRFMGGVDPTENIFRKFLSNISTESTLMAATNFRVAAPVTCLLDSETQTDTLCFTDGS